ncbi:DUF6152 family protein [Acidovorax sp. ACV01]|uniref:DUF6152 family protein n=1 Tax=Acidovorax sp. ACV01 TaxID=2769311 RepID=UPI001784321D|nr:DUF6152 family protein [Acidovorax sp. ACV01]MBD9395119.1 hypothetical protein [Acidovorax sp. ACV01]
MTHLQRRHVLLAASAVPLGVHAHHGWSSFDPERPIYLEGKVLKVRWQNPHAELELEIPAELKLPADLAQRVVPAQTSPVDGKALLAKAVLPNRKDRRWEVELAPLTRMQAWQVQEIKTGAAVSVVGFTLREEKGDAVLRAEYLFVDGKAYGLRSSPA